MALIAEQKGRPEGSGYGRLFDDAELGYLISRVQATVISSGTELERIIKNKVTMVDDLDDFLGKEIMPDGVFVADKKKVKNCTTLVSERAEPDFIIFKRRQDRQVCHIVELKDGDAFDTKKSEAERQLMHSFISQNAHRMPYIVQAHFCCFNQNDKQAILTGFKNRIDLEEAMTGKEFCELLEIDYDEILTMRKAECAENLRYFLTELCKIQAVKDFLKIDDV